MNLLSRTTASPRARSGVTVALQLFCLAWAGLAFGQEDASIARVQVEQARKSELINQIPLTGSLSAARVATLSAEVAGLVSVLEVDVGDQLEAGDTLLELNAELAEIALQRARAAAASANELAADSERRLNEAQTLGASNSIAASEVRSRRSQVEVDRSAVAVAQAEVRQREAELRRHKVSVPFPGTVSRKLVEIGEWVAPGTGLLEVISSEALHADFQVPQRFFPMVEREDILSLRFVAYPNQNFPGRVLHKVPQSNDSARTFLLRVTLDQQNVPSLLIAGMSVDATLRLASGRQGVTVNRDALLRYPDGRVTVWVVERDGEGDLGTVTEQQVRTGLSFSGRVEIESGLDAGQVVVVRGNESLHADQQVRIIDSAES
ncbi:MAG: efflux RND transporter periplasmic adaptor subunit [Pseudomonas sp.]|nr:efflux RND transporter periplasmic adaptor subunit [Pseudomonas sp.]